MALTQVQLITLKNDIIAKGAPGGPLAAYVLNNAFSDIAIYYNTIEVPDFVVWKKSVGTALIGKTVNYVAVAAMTATNLDRINNFYNLNPVEFDPSRADIRQFFADTFSGALGGQGQATRDALEALYRRNATRGEKLYATGTGTTVSPAVLVFEGEITTSDVNDAMRL